MIKTITFFIAVAIWIVPMVARSDDFYGVPCIEHADVTLQTSVRLELRAEAPYDEVVAFYKVYAEGLKDTKAIKRERGLQIVDHGNLKWHSITIARSRDSRGTSIVMVKDSWTWILGTLTLRFIGVFFVLLTLFLGMWASGAIISRTLGKEDPLARLSPITPGLVSGEQSLSEHELVAAAVAAVRGLEERKKGER